MSRVTLAATIAALTLLLLGSCGSIGPARTGTSAHFAGGISELEVQALVMQMADDYDAALGEVTYLFLRKGELDPTGRWLALSFLRNGMGAALDIGAGPNPDVALLDLLVLGSLQTWAFEKHWIPAGIDAASGAAAVARLKEAEESTWRSARRLLNEEQEQTLRGLIKSWIDQHPNQTVVSFVRFDEFTDERKSSTAVVRGQASGLLRDVGEATAAVEDARLFGERALWFASRYPYLLGQQAELTAYRIADQPEVRDGMRLLTELGDASRSLAARVDGLEDLMDSLFQRIGEERGRTIEQLGATLDVQVTKALDGLASRFDTARARAIDHFFKDLDLEFDTVVAKFDAVRGRLEGSLEGARAAAVAAADAGRALAAAVEVGDRLASRFDRDPGSGRAPLRLEDLRDTAVAAERAAVRLESALTRLDQLTGSDRLAHGLEVAESIGPKLADSLLWRGAVLIALLVGGLALVRRVPQRVG